MDHAMNRLVILDHNYAILEVDEEKRKNSPTTAISDSVITWKGNGSSTESHDLFMCPLCEYEANQGDKEQHLQVVHQIFVKFECTDCGELCKDDEALENHEEVCHNISGLGNLNDTGKQNNNPKFNQMVLIGIKRSNKIGHTSGDGSSTETHDLFMCPLCEYQGYQADKEQHLQDVHLIFVNPEFNRNQGIKRSDTCNYKCKCCDFMTPDKEEFKAHHLTHVIKCHFCDAKFKISVALENHISHIHNHKCKCCDFITPDKEEFTAHHLTHIFKCHFCDAKFKNSAALEKHVSHIHNHKCKRCDFMTSDKEEITAHRLTHVFKCHCDAKFKNSAALETHASKIHFFCKKCNKSFVLKHNRKRHMKVAHPPNKKRKLWREFVECSFCLKKVSDLPNHISRYHETKGKDFQCNVCFRSFVKNVSLEAHMEKVHKNAVSYSCGRCDFVTKMCIRLTEHVRRVHNELHTYDCNLCNSKFKTGFKLKIHLSRCHHHKCRKCDFSGATKDSLNNHKKRVHSKYKCPQCVFTCSQIISFNRHTLEVHSETHKCTHCEFVTRVRAILTRHYAVIHNDNYSFICNYCNTKFKTSGVLKIHVDIKHLGKKLKCEMCTYLAWSKGDLRVHIDCVHEKKRDRICNLCDARFGRLDTLKTYIRRVHDEQRPFLCEKCPKKYNSKTYLNMHIDNKHNRKQKLYRCKKQ